MTPDAFIAKWSANTRSERAAAQEHFIDLCRLLGEPTPNEADPDGEQYAFEKGAVKSSGGDGWADVWRRHRFAMEYKGKHKDLNAALRQLQNYCLALDNPPLLVVSDIETIVIRTNWTNTVSKTHTLTLDDLRDPAKRRILKDMMADPERLKPGQTREALTETAAKKFAELAQRLRDRGHDPEAVAHFVQRLVFCLFADDVDLLPRGLFDKLLATARSDATRFEGLASALFEAMSKRGGLIGFDAIPWFNGGLFDSAAALPLTVEDVKELQRVSALDWSEIDVSILGTLFERGLDPKKRSQLGAHYTDRDKIMRIVEPVAVRPWLARWEQHKADIAAALAKVSGVTGDDTKARTARTRAKGEAQAIYRRFLDALRSFRVLDPACGSGNFLYLSLLALKDLEHRAGLEVEAMGLQREFPQVGPEVVQGIELSPYAAELARVSVWIGAIQWARRNGLAHPDNPILRPLDNIECRDALLTPAGTIADWPAADAIVGNPPFVGDKEMLKELGADYTAKLRAAYADRIPGASNLVCFFFEKAREAVAAGHSRRVGLVATQAIRKGANRTVLDRISAEATIYEAWQNEAWTQDGAAVRVSIACFAKAEDALPLRLDGEPVTEIHADLASGKDDFTQVRRLPENRAVCFQGPVKVGAFNVPGTTARTWLAEPPNANGRPNADVIRPWINGKDITGRPSDKWIIDFAEMSEADAAFYARPFAHVVIHVKPKRDKNRRERRKRLWWQHGETVPGLRAAVAPLPRMIVTPRVAKHRLFVWASPTTLPDTRFYAIARADDVTLGILHSRFHEAWALRIGSNHGAGNDPTYNAKTCFETFPFPEGFTLDAPAPDEAASPKAAAIAKAARALMEARDRWLNPGDLVREEPEVVPGLPPRRVPVSAKAAVQLKKRTLTDLYNTRGTADGVWLDNLHAALDAAVADAYGWPADITKADALAALFRMNAERAEQGAPTAEEEAAGDVEEEDEEEEAAAE